MHFYFVTVQITWVKYKGIVHFITSADFLENGLFHVGDTSTVYSRDRKSVV